MLSDHVGVPFAVTKSKFLFRTEMRLLYSR
jgi:hypothetical protein